MNQEPKIAVVIPCYNHANVLRRTIEDIAKQTIQPFEIVVIDDGSSDNPGKVIQDWNDGNQNPKIQFVKLEKNFGAPYARNLGAKMTSSPYLLFLDADAELKPEALREFIDALEKNPGADFAYSNFFWGNKRFCGQDFNVQALKRCNYIHTSSLVKRSAFPGFDESLKKFQDWDLWLTIAEKGSTGVWIDKELFRIEPRKQGMSRWLPRIAYWIPWRLIGYQPKEIGRYREAEEIVRKKHGMVNKVQFDQDRASVGARRAVPQEGVTGETVVLNAVRRSEGSFWFWLVIIILLEAVSLATVFVPVARTIFAILAGTIVALVTLRRPAIGLTLIALELAVGSKGALLKITEGAKVDGGISLRVIIFLCFMIAWLVNAVIYWKKNSKELKPAILEILQGRWAWVALFLVCIWGFVRGLWLKNVYLMSDANAWMFLALVIPVLDVARRHGECLIKNVSQVLIAAFLWLPIKALLLLYVWSHGIAALSQPLYLWVRRTGVAEVTLVTGNLFRVFMQSQVYALLGFLLSLACLGNRTDKTNVTTGWVILIASTVSVLISLSRSFWIGLAAGIATLFILQAIYRIKKDPSTSSGRQLIVVPNIIQNVRDLFHGFLSTALRLIIAICAGIALIFSVVAFPLPKVDVGSLSTLFGSRGSTTDAAAESRWNLLPVLTNKIKQAPILGSGFGASVTYKSKDPRILAKNPDGLYTTYAFEWGWLEHWIKFGILGIPIMLWLVLSLAWRIYRSKTERWIKVGLISSLAAIATLHVFTPYLNHPLGFGFLLSMEALIEASKRK